MPMPPSMPKRHVFFFFALAFVSGVVVVARLSTGVSGKAASAAEAALVSAGVALSPGAVSAVAAGSIAGNLLILLSGAG